MIDWQILIVVDFNVQTVYVIQSMLEAEGISCMIEDPLMATNYAAAVGGVKLLVPSEDFDRAYQLLVDHGYMDRVEQDISEDVILIPSNGKNDVCPFCGSRRIEKYKYDNYIKAFVGKILSLFIPFYRDNMCCLDCRQRWKFIKTK